MDTREHWETVYQTKAVNAVSWYRPHLETSLLLIENAGAGRHAAVIDVGGGESTLVDDLLAQGYRDLTLLDISQAALDVAKRRLGSQAEQVSWLAADVTSAALPQQRYDVWHDRAVFHFLTTEEARAAYRRALLRALEPGGHLIMATFGPEGPERCSQLPVVRYSEDSLAAELGEGFSLQESLLEWHETPFGTRQQFLYCRFRRSDESR